MVACTSLLQGGNMKPYALTPMEYERLTIGEKRKYDEAIFFCRCENANGPMGGWAKGHEMLKEMGWAEQMRTEGHRSFITLVKPAKYTLIGVINA